MTCDNKTTGKYDSSPLQEREMPVEKQLENA